MTAEKKGGDEKRTAKRHRRKKTTRIGSRGRQDISQLLSGREMKKKWRGGDLSKEGKRENQKCALEKLYG